MALNRYIIILAVFIIIIALLLSFIYSQQDNAVPFESLTIGISHIESSTPFYIAQDYGFFKNNRLNITYIEYSTGLAATNAMQKSEVDIAIGVADYVFASKVLDNQPVKTIGSFAQTDFIFLVTRNDLNISNISDLAQKTIALHSGTVQEYYLGKFFELNNLSLLNVTLVNVSTIYEGIGKLVSAQVDACVVNTSYLDSIQAQLGNKAVVWSIQGNQPFFTLILCTNDWINQHQKTIEHLLTAIDQAEQYLVQHPNETQKTIKEHLNFSDPQAHTALSRNTFVLSLSPALISTLEDQARWQINNKLTNATAVPNFLDNIYFDGLAAVKPDAITLKW